jgi:mRNA interferase RelE/StbE
MYRIVTTRPARKALARVDRRTIALIEAKLMALAAEPYAPNANVKRLKGPPPPRYRLRVGDWRLVYELDDDRLLLIVVGFGPRGGVYNA